MRNIPTSLSDFSFTGAAMTPEEAYETSREVDEAVELYQRELKELRETKEVPQVRKKEEQ